MTTENDFLLQAILATLTFCFRAVFVLLLVTAAYVLFALAKTEYERWLDEKLAQRRRARRSGAYPKKHGFTRVVVPPAGKVGGSSCTPTRTVR